MSVLIQFRRGSAALWTSVNPVLADGEPGYEESTGRWKIGDGVTAWSSLSYAAEGTVRVDDLDMGGHQLVDLGDPTTDTAGLNRRTGDARYARALVRTTVKTAAYTLAPGERVPVDASGGAVPLTLPSAPADGSRFAFKIILQATVPNAVTVATGGVDVFNKTGGVTSLTYMALNTAVTFEYDAASHVYTVASTDSPLNVADGAAKLGDDGTLMGANSSGQTRGFGLVTGKGDIVVASAAKILDRLGVGADRQALLADSSQALGVKWADLPFVMIGAPSGDTTGATDVAKLQSVLAANPLATIVLQGGGAAYYANDSLPYDALYGARFLGMGGLTGGAVPPTRLIYTAGDNKPLVSAKGSGGIHLEHLMLLVNNAAYTGSLLSFDALEATVAAGQTVDGTPRTLNVTGADSGWPTSGQMIVPGVPNWVSYTGRTGATFTGVTTTGGSFTTTAGTIHGPDPWSPVIQSCYIGASVTMSSPLIALSLNRCNDGAFNRLHLVGGLIRGRKTAADYSNAHEFVRLVCNGCPSAPVTNMGQDWTVKGVFEPLADGSAGALHSSLGGETGLEFHGWCGDSNSSGDWINGTFAFPKIYGYFGSGARAVVLQGFGGTVDGFISNTSITCVEIIGGFSGHTVKAGMGTSPIGVKVGAGCHDLDLAQIVFASDVTTPISWPSGNPTPRTRYAGGSGYADAVMMTDAVGHPGRMSRFSAVYSEALGNTVGADFPITAQPGTYRIEAVGGGSGAGGGGSAALTSGTASQVGGGGGGAGGYVAGVATFATATTLTLHLGAGNIGGAGGAVSTDTSGHVGGIGSAGNDSSVSWNAGANKITAPGGKTSASGGGANSTAIVAGGSAGSAGTTSTAVLGVGQGGAAGSTSGTAGGSPSGLAGGGGSGGGPADATHGGLGGNAGSQGGYGAAQTAKNTTADGTNGADAPAGSGAGGGGGGGGAPGGKGGDGGHGGSGFIAITQIA